MKISNYIEFLTEGSGHKFRLYYTDRFRNLLKSIDYNKVSNMLLYAEDNSDIIDSFTKIDISDHNDKIQAILSDKLKNTIDYYLDTVEIKDYEDESIIPKELPNFDSKSYKTNINVGKWARRVIVDLYKSQINASEIEKFVNLYKSKYNTLMGYNNFELVDGEKIRHFYFCQNYISTIGTLGNSCMSGHSQQKYLDIYVKNPEVVKLLILKSEKNPNYINGRALLWTLKNGKKYLDRIYTNYDSDVNLFLDWVKRNKIDYNYHGKVFDILEVQLGNFEYYKYPYMDTFIFYNPEDKVLSTNSDLYSGKRYYIIQRTDGGYDNGDVVWSVTLNTYIPTEDAIEVYIKNGVTDYIYRGDDVYISNRDEYWYNYSSDLLYSEYLDGYLHKDDAVWSDCMNTYLLLESPNTIKFIISEYNDVDYCDKSQIQYYIEVDNKYYGRKDYIYDPFTGEFIFIDTDNNKDVLLKKLKSYLENNLKLNSDKEINDYLLSLYNEEKYSKKSLINFISNDSIYKSIRGVYWGFSKEYLVNEEDIISLIFKNISKSDIFINEKLKEKIKRWEYDNRFMTAISKLVKNINYADFPKDIYIIYLYNGLY